MADPLDLAGGAPRAEDEAATRINRNLAGLIPWGAGYSVAALSNLPRLGTCQSFAATRME